MTYATKIQSKIKELESHPNYIGFGMHGEDALCLRCQVLTLEQLLKDLKK